jgi:hypothetical protein
MQCRMTRGLLDGEICSIANDVIDEFKRNLLPNHNNTKFLGSHKKPVSTCVEEYQSMVSQGYSSKYRNIKPNQFQVGDNRETYFDCSPTDAEGNRVDSQGSKSRSCQLKYGKYNSRISFQQTDPVNGKDRAGCYESNFRIAN